MNTSRSRVAPCVMMVVAAMASLLAENVAAQVQVRSEFVDPRLTDPAIRELTELPGAANRNLHHYVSIGVDGPRVGMLYVHLVGSGGVPDNNRLIVEHAAALGFHVVSLAYPNYPSVQDLIAGQSDPALSEQIRRERLYGVDLSPLVVVSRADCIENRLVKLLAYVDGQHPGEGWAGYLLAGGLPDWNRVIVGGHSQGAGHVALLTKDHRLGGAVMFAGPGDFVDGGGGAAPWLSLPSRTPGPRLIAFTHIDDPSAQGFLINQNTLGLNAFGPVRSVDNLAPPYLGSHRLTSTRPPPSGSSALSLRV